MNSRDAGATESPTSSRPTARELLLGRRYGVHRLIVFCLVVALVAVIVYAVAASRTSTLDSLPGVVRVDGSKHEVELSARITPGEARQVFDRAQDLEDSWTLLIGPVSLTTPRGSEVIEQHGSVDLLQRLGAAELAEAGVITIDPYAPVIEAEPATPERTVALTRALVAALAADKGVVADRIAVRDSPAATEATVAVVQTALRRPGEVDAVLGLLEGVPNLSQAVLGEQIKVRVGAEDEAGTKAACRDARQALGERTDIELSVWFSTDPERGDESDPKSRPC